MKKNLTIVSIILFSMLAWLCCDDHTTAPKPVIKYESVLTVDYAGPSFVALYFTISDSGNSRDYYIRRDKDIVLSGSLKGIDTIVTDWSAKPSTEYTYQLLVGDSLDPDTSNWTTTTTMDTTSHDFTWEKITFLEQGYCSQVKVISENDVWVVGEFHDTSDNFRNASHFNGYEWEPLLLRGRSPMFDIQVFSNDDIWAVSYFPNHFDGLDWTFYQLQNMNIINNDEGAIFKMWGPSSHNMYFIGNNVIVHYNGEEFCKIPDVPEYEYYRIDGIEEPGDYGERIWVGSIGETDDISKRGGMYYYDGSQWQSLWNNDIDFFPNSIYKSVGALWTSPEDKWVVFCVAGRTDCIVTIHNQKYVKEYCQLYTTEDGAPRCVHGNNVNDFFVVGDFGNVLHYNGSTFHRFSELAGSRHISVSQYGEVVYVAHENGAIVYRGTRN